MRRHPATALALLLMACSPATASGSEAASSPRLDDSGGSARSRFEDAKFGIGFRWGVFSLLGKGEGVMEADRLPVAEYEKLPPRFHPRKFDAEAWVDAARAAGARYVVVSAKGPDGFCMFGTDLTTFDVVDATPFGRDPLAALAEACRARGVALVISYSLLDWHHPDSFPRGRTGRASGRPESGDWDAYLAFVRGQLRELCTHYGEVAGFRLEGIADRPLADWGLDGMLSLIRELQPDALIGTDVEGAAVGEDVLPLDHEPSAHDGLAIDGGPALELGIPLNQSRGFNPGDKAYKSPSRVVRALVIAAGSGANLLLGVGPGPDGSIGPESAVRLAEVGRLLRTRGEALYGTRGGPVSPGEWGVSTRKGEVVNLHVLEPETAIRLPSSFRSHEAHLGGAVLPWKPGGDGLILEIPEELRSPFDTIVTLRPSGSGN